MSYPILFSILHMCANFHENRPINKDFFFGLVVPLIAPSFVCTAGHWGDRANEAKLTDVRAMVIGFRRGGGAECSLVW